MPSINSRLRLILTLAFALQGLSFAAHAQAISQQEKFADLFVFGGYNYTAPDYGPDSVHDNGLTYGADYTRYIGHSRIAPSLEVRGTYVTGPVVSQNTISGGVRVHTTVQRRYRPYANFLVGLGKVHFNQRPIPSYTDDEGLMYSYGGGIDIDVYRTFAFKADYQYQSWNLGENSITKPQGGNFTLAPHVVTIGVSYRIPFRSYLRHDDPKIYAR